MTSHVSAKDKKERYIGIQVGAALKLALVREADRRDESVGALCRRALRGYLKRVERRRAAELTT